VLLEYPLNKRLVTVFGVVFKIGVKIDEIIVVDYFHILA
jgi:hypothetical protein